LDLQVKTKLLEGNLASQPQLMLKLALENSPSTQLAYINLETHSYITNIHGHHLLYS